MLPPSVGDSVKKPLCLLRPQRLIELISLLEGGDAWTTDQLADYFFVARRTIFRDLQLLRKSNIPVVFDPMHQGYRLQADGDCNCPKTSSQWLAIDIGNQVDRICNCPKISASEVAALVLAIKILGPLPPSIAGLCNRALGKIVSAASPAVRQQATAMLDDRHEFAEQDRREILELRQSG